MFGILFIISICAVILLPIVILIFDVDPPADAILGSTWFIAVICTVVFGLLAAFLGANRYSVYKKEDNRVWLERDDGLYFWVDNLNAPDEGNVIYLSYSDLKRYSTSIK